MCIIKIFGVSFCQQVFQGNKSLIIQFDSTNQSSCKSCIKWDSAKNSIGETQKICSAILMRDKETEKLTIFQNWEYLKEIFQCNTHFNDCLEWKSDHRIQTKDDKRHYDLWQNAVIPFEGWYWELWTSFIHTGQRIRTAGDH